jgi:hypothetical protein
MGVFIFDNRGRGAVLPFKFLRFRELFIMYTYKGDLVGFIALKGLLDGVDVKWFFLLSFRL